MATEQRRRRFHHRSRNGCNTCKSRHIRCDEAKPYCYNCLTAGTECGYPCLVDVDIAENPRRSSVNNQARNILIQQWQREPPTSVPGQVGPTNPDPFRTLGVEMTATSAMLFHHFNSYRILVRTPVTRKPGGKMLEMALSDPALLHGCIMLAANHWVLLGGDLARVASAFYSHKIGALRLINERLGSIDTAKRDGTVGSIACLVLAENSLGFTEAAVCHMNALERLVRIRGDFGSASMNALLQRMIILADLHVAATTSTKLRFASTDQSQGLIPSRQDLAQRSSNFAPPYNSLSSNADLESVEGLTDKTKQLFLDLRRLSSQMTRNTSGAASQGSTINELIRDVESYTDSIIHNIARTDIVTTAADFASGCWAIAANIYIYMFFRQLPIHNTVYDWELHLLKEAIERIREVFPYELFSPALWFWTVFVGCCVRSTRAEGVWFRRELVKLRQELGIKEWYEVKRILDKLVWMGEFHEFGQGVWDKIG